MPDTPAHPADHEPEQLERADRALPQRCVATLEQEEGPYYRDLGLVRSDIREDRTGVEIRLGIRVLSIAGTAVEGAAVDIWHCDALGIYSWHDTPPSGSHGLGDAGLSPGTFLRGRQRTDGRGECEFLTIFPGWYSGRSVHIHVKVHHRGGVLTTQLYFPEELTDAIHRLEPYRVRPRRDTINAEDAIYDDVGETTMLHPVARRDGYSANIILVVAHR